MRTDDTWFIRLVIAALALVAAGQALAGCSDPSDPAPILASPSEPEQPAEAMSASTADTPPKTATSTPPNAKVRDPRGSWCEPLDQPFCSDERGCSDGARCVRPWWAEVSTTTKVCARQLPDRAERRWRAARLRVMVDRVCSRAHGCEPNALHAYLRVVALRESTWRPWKRHRLDPDLDAAQSAWTKHRDKFTGNPAAANPDRWGSGVGLYGQIPALWLPRWDSMAPPETLCGEVEATEVHLRAARDQVRKIAAGVDCDGDGERDYFGSSLEHGPSWYDVSRVNSGSLCPGSTAHRDAFEGRARKAGLDPWGPVSVVSLGRAIPVEGQDETAAEIRAAMDAVAR